MAFSVLPAGLTAATAPAGTQPEQLAHLSALFPAGVELRCYGAGDVLRTTVLHAGWELGGTTHRFLEPGAYVSEAFASEGLAAYGICAVPGGPDILRYDLAVSGPVASTRRTNLGRGSGAEGLKVFANRSLPVDNNNARLSSWGQSNAEESALRSGIADITADPELVEWDNGTRPFTRVLDWNGTAYVQFVPGLNSTSSTTMGPKFGMAVWWMRSTTTGILLLDKNAFGGTSIELFVPGAARWNSGISSRAAQDAWLAANGITIPSNRTGMLWSQAEADSGQTGAWYQPKMQSIVDGWVANGLMPYRGVLTDIPPGSPRYNAGISAAKQAVADTTGGLVVKQIEPPFPANSESDNLHLNARGQVQRSFNFMSFIFDAPTITV